MKSDFFIRMRSFFSRVIAGEKESTFRARRDWAAALLLFVSLVAIAVTKGALLSVRAERVGEVLPEEEAVKEVRTVDRARLQKNVAERARLRASFEFGRAATSSLVESAKR